MGSYAIGFGLAWMAVSVVLAVWLWIGRPEPKRRYRGDTGERRERPIEDDEWQARVYERIMEEIHTNDWVGDLRADHERHKRGMGVTKCDIESLTSYGDRL